MRGLVRVATACLVIVFLLGCGGRSSSSISHPNESPQENLHSETESLGTTAPPPSSILPSDQNLADSIDLPETNYYEIRVPQGTMVLRLYDETPQHRDNFKKLVENGFYDGTTFHRVVEGFMIQGGDPNSRDDNPYNDGHGDPGYTLPAEFVPHLFHKRGAVAAARTGDVVNPERRSSGSQFYIVQGSVVDEPTLDQIENTIRMARGMENFAFSDTMRRTYLDIGGAPNLDGQYTVFGEIVAGLDVLDAVASVPTPRRSDRPTAPQLIDRPLEEVTMTIVPLHDYSP